MNKMLKIVVDADAIIAQANSDDIHHERAMEISEFLAEISADVMYPSTTIVEAVTYIQRVLNSSLSAFDIATTLAEPDIHVVQINQETLKNALYYFNPRGSKKNTLFDCIVAHVAKEHRADAIFSFDQFYAKKGFTLAEELKGN